MIADASTAGPSPERILPRVPFERYLVALVGAWTLLVGASLWWTIDQGTSRIMGLALDQARVAQRKDVSYRAWCSGHGGVYAPVTTSTAPNPYLTAPERDLLTPSGRLLTLVNPAYMTRQVHEREADAGGVRGHLTSLKPLRPQNEPDGWERGALAAFAAGQPEVVGEAAIAGKTYLRFMRPLLVEQSCLACHAAQGYRVGDIRGGLSVSVPLQPFLDARRRMTLHALQAHGALWCFVVIIICLAARSLSSHVAALYLMEAKLLASEEFLEGVLAADDAGILVLARDFTVLRASEVMRRLFPGALTFVGRPCHVSVRGTSGPCAGCPGQVALQTGEVATHEETVTSRDGGRRVCEVTAYPLRSSSGMVIGVVERWRDVTERRRKDQDREALLATSRGPR